MRGLICLLGGILATATTFAQAPVQPVILTKPEAQNYVTVVEVKPHFVTAIRMAEPVHTVAIGDPKLFQVEHSPHEPNVIFVKPLTAEPAESNVLISTGGGHEMSLLVVSKGNNAKAVDFVIQYHKRRSFLIAPDYPSELVGETMPATEAVAERPFSPVTLAGVMPKLVSGNTKPDPIPGSAERRTQSSLDVLLARQEHAPLPKLYGEHPELENTRGDHVQAGVSEVIDGGQEVIVLFSAVNPINHAILLVPPQVELGGKVRRGKIFRHSEWTTSEELMIEDFRLSRRRLGPGERADGVVMFARPPYKQSNETLFLQLAEAGAIDKPALAPIGFGVSKFRESEARDERAAK